MATVDDILSSSVANGIQAGTCWLMSHDAQTVNKYSVLGEGGRYILLFCSDFSNDLCRLSADVIRSTVRQCEPGIMRVVGGCSALAARIPGLLRRRRRRDRSYR